MRLFELGNDRPSLDKEFPRNIMPQIRIEHLKDSPFQTEHVKELTANLKPVQTQRVKGMVDKAKRGFADGTIRPIIVDKDNYIVNGHHRYDVARGNELDRVNVIRVDATIEELIKHFSSTASQEPTMKEQLQLKLELAIKLRETERIDEIAPAIAWGVFRSYITKHGAKAAALWLLRWMFKNIFTLGGMVIISLVQMIVGAVVKGTVKGLGKVSVLLYEKIKEKVGERKAQKLMKQLEEDLEKELNQDGSISNVNMATESEVRVLTIQEVTDLAITLREDVVSMNTYAKKPFFSPEEADRANDEWVNQAQVDQDDGVMVKATDGKQYRIMTSYGNQHFEDGEVYLDGITDPDYIDTDGYPDAAELLYYHSPTGHYVEEANSKKPKLPKQNNPVAKHSRNMSGAGSHKSTKDYDRKNKKKDISSQLDEGPYVASRRDIVHSVMREIEAKAHVDDNFLHHLAELIGKKLTQRNKDNHRGRWVSQKK